MTNYVVVSYVPLFMPSGSPGQYYDVDVAFEIFRDGEDLSNAHACMWIYDKEVKPVLVLDRARDIAEHLKVWADGHASEWFDLHIGEKDGTYAMVLVPNIKKSIDRFRQARKISFGDNMSSDARIEVLFNPIKLISNSIDNYHRVKDHITSTMSLYFIDTNDLDAQNPQNTDLSKLIEVGTFKVVKDSGHVSSFINDFKQQK